MENKRYLDKVIGSLLRSTNMDYDNDKIHYPFPSYFSNFASSSISFFFSSYFSDSSFPLSTFFTSFTEYCKNTFGLTDQEIDHVWNKYRKIIIDKIEN